MLKENRREDAELIEKIQRRASRLRADGYDEIATELEIAAGHLAEHMQIPDRITVLQPGVPVLTYIGPERRLRPRNIYPTKPEGFDR